MPRLSVFAFLFLVAASLQTTATAQNAEVDLSSLFEGIDLRPSSSAFIAPPREVIRPLTRSKKLLAKNEVGEAVEILGELLDNDAAEDYLISRGSTSFESLRRRTETILGSIDESFLEPYRVRYRIRARKMLEKGVAESNPSLLKQVSNRFFFTESGSEAAMLLGHMDLSRGQPSSARAWFSKVVRFRSTANRHDPEASILLATCQLLGRERDQAEATLVSLKNRQPNSVIKFQGKVYPLFGRDEEALPWLTSLIGDSPLAANSTLSEWLMVQGNPARTGKTGVGLPLMSARWQLPIGDSLAVQKETSGYLKELIEQEHSPMPASQPLVVKETVVYRDAERLYGVDFKTGRRQWTFPPQLSWKRKPIGRLSSDRKRFLYQRLASDSLFGRASSDGELVFFVPNPGASFDNNYGMTADATNSAPTDVRQYNELVALDVGRQGALSWRVGGPTGLDEPKLAKTYFMGEPLPLEGVLYCCCVRENAVELVALDANNGSLRWAQSIASYSGDSFTNNHFRRLAGVTPSYADGKLVCLTGTGGVVALELATRSLIWGHEFQLPEEAKVVGKSYADALTDVWRDAAVTIDSGRVFLTPVLSRNVLCLNLDDGTCGWLDKDGYRQKRVPRNESLYLAGVAENRLILVGAKDVRSIDAVSGDEQWRLELPKNELITGRGYLGDGRLFLPGASRKILQIELKSGKIVDSVATGRILGNLARVGGDVLSLGFDHLASFPERGLSEKAIEKIEVERLSEQQQFVRAQMMIQKGDTEAGLDLLIALARDNPAEQYVSLMKSLVSFFAESELALSIKTLDALKEIYPQVDVGSLEQSRGLTELRMGRFEQSAMGSLAEIEKKFAELKVDEIQWDRTGKQIAARLIDRQHDFEKQALDPRIKPVANENQGEMLRYSEIGWRRVKLLMAVEGLRQSDQAEALAEISEKAKQMISAAMSGSEKKFSWLIAQFHEEAIDRETLLEISRHLLEKKRYLQALQYANIAIRRAPEDSCDARLLKAELLLSGKDAAAALEVMQGIDAAAISEPDQQQRQELWQQATDMAQSNDRLSRLTEDRPVVPFPGNTRTIPGESLDLSKKMVRAAIGYRFGTPQRIQTLNMAWTWFNEDSHEKKLEIRDASGSVLRRLQIDKNGGRNSVENQGNGDFEMQGQVARLTIGEVSYFVDWFKVIAGQGGNLWSMPGGSLHHSKSVISEGREFVYVGHRLECCERLTGARLWRRDLKHEPKRIVKAGDSVAVWSDENRSLRFFDISTGRLLKSFQSKDAFVKKVVGDLLVFHHPVRKGDLSPEQRARLVDEVENESENEGEDEGEDEEQAGQRAGEQANDVAERYLVFDPKSEAILWQRLIDKDERATLLQDGLTVLTTDGRLERFGLATGELVSEVDLELDPQQQGRAESFDLRAHTAGWILQLGFYQGGQGFKKGSIDYWCSPLRKQLRSGPVFLLNDSRTKCLWQSPVHLEDMELAWQQPADSPALIFGRKLMRQGSPTEVSPSSSHLHLILLDARQGKVIGDLLLKSALDEMASYAFDWVRADTIGDSYLTVTSDQELKRFFFYRDPEQPPVPGTHLTFNAFNFFEDPAFERPKRKLIDEQLSAFQARAKDAEKRRNELQAGSAQDLKKKMGVSGP